MRFMFTLLCLVPASLVASPVLAGRFDDIEDAAEEYRDAVAEVREDIDESHHVSPHVDDLVHRLEHAAEVMEELSDDDDPLHDMLGAYERVAALHRHFADDTSHGIPVTGRHAAKHLEQMHHRFSKLAAEVEIVAYGPRYGHHISEHAQHEYRVPGYANPGYGGPRYSAPELSGRYRMTTPLASPSGRIQSRPAVPPRPMPSYEQLPPPRIESRPTSGGYDPAPAYPIEYPQRPQRNLRSQLINAALSEILN